MGLISKTVVVGLNGGMATYYENLGYVIPKIKKDYKIVVPMNSTIEVDIDDLKKGSNVVVDAKCDCCGKESKLQYGKYLINIKKHNGKYICSSNKSHRDFLGYYPSRDDILNQIKEFYNIHNRFPKYNEYTESNNFKFSYSAMMSVLRLDNIKLQDELAKIDCFKCHPNVKYYNLYIEKLSEIVSENPEIGQNILLLDYKKYSHFGIPKIDWLIKNCPDKTVVNIDSLKHYANIYTNVLSKKECTEIIYDMNDTYGRPLMYDDFRGRGYGKVTISNLRDYWGSLNKMKKALGLEIIQESMIDKQLSKLNFDNMIDDICSFVNEDGRNFITTREIDTNKKWVTSDTLRRMCKKYYSHTLPEHLKSYGIDLGKQGNGINYDFKDGEHVTSQFEYMFSKFLKEYGLIYNKDYFRDVKYSKIESNYHGNMNCDYEIRLNDKTIYIEIAGIIEAYKTWYYLDKPITRSQTKEKYRLKLKEKEKMLRNNNHTYFILFPSDLTRDIFMSFLQNPTIELRHNIENFMKNNIDWVAVRNLGELKYTDKLKWGRNQIDYSKAM